MTQWTENARQNFDRYCVRARESLMGTGADPEEVIDDLRRHVDEEVARAKLTVVTEEDMQRILNRVGEPANAAGAKPGPERPTPAPGIAQPTARRQPGWWLLFLGVILPCITMGFELVTGMSAGVLFAPCPIAPRAL